MSLAGAERKEGDWFCLQCGDHQFKQNAACRTCKAVRTYSEQEQVEPELPDPEIWINSVEIDQPKKDKFLALSFSKQEMVMRQGPLIAARDPTAILASRLNRLPRDAETNDSAPQGQHQSSVKRYNVHKGWGFIDAIEAGGANDIFLHSANIVDGSTPLCGDMLTFDFEPVPGKNGQFNAINVRGGRGKTPNPETLKNAWKIGQPFSEMKDWGLSAKGKSKDGGKGKGGGKGGGHMDHMWSMFEKFYNSMYSKGRSDAAGKGSNKGSGDGGWWGTDSAGWSDSAGKGTGKGWSDGGWQGTDSTAWSGSAGKGKGKGWSEGGWQPY